MLTHPSYVTTRREKVAAVEEEKVAKEKKKADKVLRDKEKLAEREAKKAKKTEAREDLPFSFPWQPFLLRQLLLSL